MTQKSRNILTGAPAARPDDVLAELIAMLTLTLRLEHRTIDPEVTFRSMGFNSRLFVEFVSAVNKRFGTDFNPDVLLDHPTPSALARIVTREIDASGVSVIAGAPPDPARPTTPACRQPNVIVSSAVTSQIVEVLREDLGRILSRDPWDIDATDGFGPLGLDIGQSLDFVEVVNRTYGIQEPADTLRDHPNLTSLAARVASLVAVAPPDPETAGRVVSRDGRFSGDEALGLRPHQA